MIRVGAKECSLRRYVGKITVNYRLIVKAAVIGKAFAQVFVPQVATLEKNVFS